METQNFVFNLQTPFNYAFKGEKRDASFISIQPPTMKEHHLASQLKQSIMHMLRKDQLDYAEVLETNPKKATDTEGTGGTDDSGELTPELILALIFSSASIDANVIFGYAKEIFKSGLAQVDGEHKLTYPLMEKMTIDDFQNLTGEYIVNFILA